MKVGDKVRSTKQPGIYKIFESHVVTTLDFDDKPVVRVSYLAIDEGPKNRTLKFYGYDVNKTVFEINSVKAEQLSLFN